MQSQTRTNRIVYSFLVSEYGQTDSATTISLTALRYNEITLLRVSTRVTATQLFDSGLSRQMKSQATAAQQAPAGAKGATVPHQSDGAYKTACPPLLLRLLFLSSTLLSRQYQVITSE